MKVYLDDIRLAPIGWFLVRTADECIIALSRVDVDELSLDHDLGAEQTGYDVVKWMVENNVWPKRIILHTMNPVGRENMARTIERYAPDTTVCEIKAGWCREHP